MPEHWKLSPSDFAFLWEQCRRCFYLKVVRGVAQPITMPGIFNRIDSILKQYFAGKSTGEIAPVLPPGTVVFGEKWVESSPIAVPGHRSTCFIRGKVDSLVGFEDGSYGVVDFKTSSARGHQLPLYARQLHSYAYALENPAPGKLNLAPVSRLGLLCVEPVEVLSLEEGGYAYRVKPTWIECPRDDGAFLAFIGQVLAVLDLPEPPASGPTCRWCRYVEKAQQNLLL
jgi:hypothetical protein